MTRACRARLNAAQVAAERLAVHGEAALTEADRAALRQASGQATIDPKLMDEILNRAGLGR